MKNKIIIGLLGVLLLLLISGCTGIPEKKEIQNMLPNTITLILPDGIREVTEFSEFGMTAFEQLQNHYNVGYESTSVGKYVTCINSLCQEKQFLDGWWAFWVNNELSNTGAEGVIITDGMAIGWEYTKDTTAADIP